MHLLRLGAAALLTGATGVAAQEDDVPHFELDVIFPRNETTYNMTDFFPPAVAVQNPKAARLMGDFDIYYVIMGRRDNGIPTGRAYTEFMESKMEVVEGAGRGDDYEILVANSNATYWSEQRTDYTQTFEMQFYFRWWDYQDHCRMDDPSFIGRVFFNVVGGSMTRFPEIEELYEGDLVEADLMAVPECPYFADAARVRLNATDETCSTLYDFSKERGAWHGRSNSTLEGTPCAVVVDDKMKKRIVDKAASMAAPSATPPYRPENSPPAGDGDEEDAAVGLRPHIALAWATSFALGCLAFVV